MPKLPGFIRFLYQRSRSMMLAMIGVGILSGMCSAGVLALINRVLQHGSGDEWLLAVGFLAIVSGKLVAQVTSQLMLTRFSQDTTLELSLALCQKILSAPFRRTEVQGPSRIQVILSDDVSMLAWAIQCLPQFAMSTAIVVGCGIYLAWLSWPSFLLVVSATVMGALGYQWLHTRAFSMIYASREARTQLFRHFRSLTDGIKELLLHRDRRTEFLDREMHAAADRYRFASIEASKQYALAEAWSHLAFYTMIGVIIFVLPRLVGLTSESLIGYVVVLLYMMSPIWAIIGTLPTIEKGQVAFDNIQKLGISLEKSAAASPSDRPLPPRRVGTVAFEGVTFRYSDESTGKDSFRLGPIDLVLRPGELVFVIGGNGSGKSTFVKVLAGLYVPGEGTISLDGTVITDADREWYREHFSVVFSDFYLFEKLLGIDESRVRSQAGAYLARLQIDHKISVSDRTFSTTDLSQGQRKRLALVTAYLEDRPIYVFDEWAADQDPQYKEIFYHDLLQDLRARGKCVVVITHDDRYFHLGDRVIKLEDGKVVDTQVMTTRIRRRVSDRT